MAKKQIKKYVFEPGISKDDSLYPNAVALLLANKAFLQAQVVAFINNQITNNIAPYSGYTYAPEKCTRDVGFFIDAVAHDLRYGGNVESRKVADYFWIDGEPMIRGDVAPEITGQQYLRDIINNYIFTNTTVTPTYGQTAVSQVKITGSNAETGASARNTTLWGIFGTVITNGVTSMPAKVPGVSSIKMLGRYTPSEILLITDTTNGNILYNFSDPATAIEYSYKDGRSSGNGELLSDLDFPAWWHTTDTITTMYLSADTSALSSTTDLQIFVEEPHITTRPWDFGTDAIERIRVSNPQAMLDADFEYGLQPTKWQALGLIRSYPSLYEIPGTDLTVTAITTDASVATSGFGSSLITVTCAGAHGFSANQPITVKGLNTSVPGFGRAEGSFLVYSTPSSLVFTYYASAKVGTTLNQSLYTSFVQIREADYYTGSAIGQPTFSIFSNGSSSTIGTKFNTSTGSTSLAFNGSSPAPGSPISGSLSIPVGTSVSGVIGSGTITANILDTITDINVTSITIQDATGVQQGMAIESGTGGALFINSIAGTTLNLSGAIGALFDGSNGTDTGLSGTIVESIGTESLFDVTVASEVYTVTNSDDSSSNGQNYAVGDIIKILGSAVGGIDVTNDITVTVTEVDSAGTIVNFTFAGSASGVSDGAFTGVIGSNELLPGSSAVFTITRSGGAYSATPTTGGSNYKVGNRILILGSGISNGISPDNDVTVTVSTVDGGGAILTASADGDTPLGDPIAIYPVLTLSESLTADIADGVTLSVGAIATCQIDFTSPHGIVPGTTMFNFITSSPSPGFAATSRTLPSSNTWTSAAYLNGIFVAVASGTNATAYSTNGTSWLAGGNLPSSATWTAIAAGTVAGTDYFVAIASGGTAAAYSTDGGLNWTSATLPSSGTWSSIAFFDGTFVAVRSGSTAGAYSTNGGQTWTASTLPGTNPTWTDVVGGFVGTSSFFVAIASGGTQAAYSTDNGISWVTATLPSSSNWSSVAFGNSRFVAVATGGTAAAYSTNGITWTASTLPSTANWNSIDFGEESFLVIADGSTSALTSPNGEPGTWTARTSAGTATWQEVVYGAIPGSPIFVVVGNGTSAQSIILQSANHQLAAGPFVVSQVPSPTTVRYPARSTGFIDTTTPLAGTVYMRPDAFFVHRPFDGGVQLGTGGPAHASQAIRQSKKYIRYQSGKGMMYTTGALFAPSYNIQSASAAGLTSGSFITFTTDDTDHGLQPGAEIEIIGMVSFEYNGDYIVESIVDSRRFRVRANVVLSSLTGTISSDAKVVLKRWHGSTVRVGPFDEQNGIFYQYDGQKMSLVKRSSTLQLAGTVNVTPESNLVSGTNTRFQDQLKAGDKIVIRGMTHTVTSVVSQTSMTVAPDWRGANAVVGARLCLTQDLVFPQSEWNVDPCDGTGPSGYNFLPWRMQMIGMQYTWYAAGFIEYMLRGADGKFITLHRIRNSNVNTEAYMRTANLPVRYEVENTGARSKLKSAMTSVSTTMSLSDASDFPSTGGIVYVDNELISYTGKTNDTLTGLSRAASMNNFAAGLNRTYTAGPADDHSAGTGVILVSCTCTPTISHWGSALLTDGLFDEDRGYLFSYASTGLSVSTSKQTAFMIRLAPSVSNALVGDLGERDLLNRAQLLLQEIAITSNAQATADQGAIVIEGVLNPSNYPTNPANITWTGLSSSGAGGQPSFAQIALGGSINWGGIPGSTSTATVNGAVTATTTARAFSTVNRSITARRVASLGFGDAIQSGRNTFLVLTSDYDAIVNTPLRIGDRMATSGLFFNGQTISSIERNWGNSGFPSFTNYTRITLSSGADATNSNDVSVSITSIISTTYASAFSTSRNDFLVTNADFAATQFQVGDRVSVATFLTGGQTIQTITTSFARVNGTDFTRVVMNTSANSTSGTNTNITTTFTVTGSAASYTGNFLFFTNSSWNASGATIGTRVAASFTQFPAGAAVSKVETRTLGGTTVRKVTFTQSATTAINAAATVTFQFGDPQYALPGEQVFSFITNPGETTSLDLSKLKELTTTAIGGRGTFPNGPDVLAINVLKVGGTATPTSVVLRWGEAQA